MASCIGKGRYGVCFLARDPDGNKVVLKKFRPRMRRKNRNANHYEAVILSGLCHPAVPGLLGVINSRRGYYFVLEYKEGRTLKEWLFKEKKVFTPGEIFRIGSQLFEVLAYLHGRNVVHGDISISNVVYDTERISLLDFGLARYADGQCIRFNETDVRSTGRVSMGVRGMNLGDNDVVIGMQMSSQGKDLLIVSEKGMGKRTSMEEFTKQNRGGKGVKCYKITEKTGNVVGMKAVDEDSEIMIINTEGIVIRMKCSDISQYGRITSGVKLINLPEHEKVASVAKVRKASAEIDGEQVEISEEAEERQENQL